MVKIGENFALKPCKINLLDTFLHTWAQGAGLGGGGLIVIKNRLGFQAIAKNLVGVPGYRRIFSEGHCVGG